MGHLLISAAHKSSGKTTVSLGLCRALKRKGLTVQPFKKGPDYIDPMWLEAAAGQPCRNLDFYTMTADEILGCFAVNSRTADIAIVEGNKGLYDGLHLDGSNSNAALAKMLGAPVVLVIDARGMTRGIAPLILGYQAFEPDINIAGVILNKIGGRRHEAKLRAIIEHYTDVPLIGAVQRAPEMEILERHLGLVPSNEEGQSDSLIDTIADALEGQVDLDALIKIGQTARFDYEAPAQPQRVADTTPLKIGIARDSAFGFYYTSDLEALTAAGAELVPIDTMHDQSLPPLDGLFIGGGFPETHAIALEGNAALRTSIAEAVEDGLPTYAECGGLMYLCRSLTWDGVTCEMVGVIPADVTLHDTPQGRGYVRLKETGSAPWPAYQGKGGEGFEFPGHEFHYSRLEGLPEDTKFAYEVTRGYGIDGKNDGIVYKNMLASYSHLRDAESHHWAHRFVALVRTHKDHLTQKTA